MFRNVVVGVNDHDGGRDAIALAKLLLGGDGELTLAHVFHEEPPGPYRWTDTRVADDRERASSDSHEQTTATVA
jgi:hypothetical protein